MERKAPKMSKSFLIGNTELAKARLSAVVLHAENLKNDPDHKKRMERQECSYCFYGSRFGGSAMTYQPCMCCGSQQVYSNTSTDVLCKMCAIAGALCKHCGADINLRTRRKEWPEPLQTQENP